MLYETAPVALLHSLEAVHGWTAEDFDVRKVKHHMVRGSMKLPSGTMRQKRILGWLSSVGMEKESEECLVHGLRQTSKYSG